MKKLLSLLSVVTISGIAIPNVIAASFYQKQEKLDSEINYLQTNNLNFLSRIKRQNYENNKINKIRIIIKTNNVITSSGIALNNKLYFGSWDGKVYEYDPATGQQKIVITTKQQIWSSGIILNNKLYFGSHDHNVYEYDPITGQQKIVITTNGIIISSGIALNNKLYFGSGDHNVYEYDPITGQQKIVITTKKGVESSGLVLNNKLYFGSHDHNVYEYDPATGQQKIVITTNGVIFGRGIALNNKLYFGSGDHNVYEYDPITGQQKIVITTNDLIRNFAVILNNKLYFGSYDHNVYEYDPATGQKRIIITTNEAIESYGVVFNNKLYFGSHDHNVYEWDPITGQQKVIFKANDKIAYSGIVFNNKLYFGSYDHNVYEYDPNYYNLRQINNSSDTLILNELNYLNPDLDISQLEIINKTNNLAIVKSKNNLNNDIKLEISYSIDNEQNKIIKLNELIKKAVFFKFRDENPNLKFKEINYLDINNLNFGSVEVTKNKDLKRCLEFKNVCFTEKEHINRFLNKKTYYIPKCEYNQKIKFMFQIIMGLSKDGQDNTKNGWILNMNDENKLGNFVDLNYAYTIMLTNILSNDFDFTNLKKQEQEMIFVFNEPEDKIELDPNEKAIIAYSVRENKYESMLNLKQNIYGQINARIIILNNEVKNIILTIKEAMQILQKYSLLPDEIILNEDNSITFNGKAIFSRIAESKPQLILKTEII